MKTVVIREIGDCKIECTYELDISKNVIKDCCGCWSCWWKTPGRMYK